ncbi:hypothetical protein HY933_01990 [Candidatus Falkowbacteria bacterium]|nr:hypothetical protein [Candidatus Falkowbacteria bacterium]
MEKQTLGYILAGFGFVTGLAWNEAIKALINFIFPFAVSSLLAEFIYAIILTLLVVVIGRYLAKLSK